VLLGPASVTRPRFEVDSGSSVLRFGGICLRGRKLFLFIWRSYLVTVHQEAVLVVPFYNGFTV
jgi:hypothetical protein